jgi:hypothetical protein
VDVARESPLKKFWPLWVAIGFPLLLVALNSTAIEPDFFFVVMGIPLLMSIWTCLGIWVLILTVRLTRRGEWSRAVASAILPLVILGAGVRFRQFIRLCNDGGDVVHFIAERSSYLREIRATPANGAPRLLVFNRGGMIWASRGYVYDESDEILREEPLRSADWRARAEGTELSCGYYAQPFPGHFAFTQHWYLASFPC